MKRLVLMVLWLAWATLTQAQSFGHGTWDGLLQRHVKPILGGVATQVDYGGMARERVQLKGYLDALAAVPEAEFRRWPRDERLAFLINAYNAGTVELVLTRWPKLDSIKDLGSLLGSPWKKRFIPLLGGTRSLDDIEHGMIRAKGAYAEPRIHFAVNCASVGCPALRPEAYTAARLDAQLADATRRFLGDRTRNRVCDAAPAGRGIESPPSPCGRGRVADERPLAIGGTGGVRGDKRIEVSSLFKWYGDDFQRAGGLRAFLADQGEALGLMDVQRQALRDGSLKMVFLDYDWRLNGTP